MRSIRWRRRWTSNPVRGTAWLAWRRSQAEGALAAFTGSAETVHLPFGFRQATGSSLPQRLERQRPNGSASADALRRAPPAGGLSPGPAPDQGREARIIGDELVEVDQVDAAAGHTGCHFGGDPVAPLGPPLREALGETGAVLEVADQLLLVGRTRQLLIAFGVIAVVEGPSLLVSLAPVEDHGRPAAAGSAVADQDHLGAGRADVVAAQVEGQIGAIVRPPPERA